MRDAEATKERILETAMKEFSSYGIAGARVDRIAKQAKCNKNLIYIYFENKETLFTTVLQKHLTRVYEEITFTPEDLPGFAAKVFDWAMAHPDILRLMEWNKLENKTESFTERAAAQDKKIKMIKNAQNVDLKKTTFTPEFLLSAIMTLATAWAGINPFAMSLDSDDQKKLSQTRTAIVEAIKLMTQGTE
ncbi:putative TetR family regulatory protein [Pullulanibacillus camelliae]|uniref:Putative TetR family regulatory protein n=1 Tax=Pullulanibacillus camelliae TaxID=1707096 RepID=A0A8J2VPQ8_9BACL|nr:TetR family transcriptional regulator [Pullulanibacillus camelliae]GGE33391.1 putative TetR family regulatory protein [Pullulanibacillus camelliae]